MKLLILLAAVWSLSAFAITFDEDPSVVTCVPSLDNYGTLYINIQVSGKTVAPYELDENQTTVDCPEANAAVAFCRSVTDKAIKLVLPVTINTDVNNFDSGDALTVDYGSPSNGGNTPPSRTYRRTYSTDQQ